MPLSPEAFYLQLRQLVDEMPDLAAGPITRDTNEWLGRAMALVEATGDMTDIVPMKVAATNLDTVLRASNAQMVMAIVYKTLSKAEMNAPAAMQGSFLPAGKPFDTLMRVGTVLDGAKTDALLIDPYADAKVLEYAVLAPERVRIRVLTDKEKHKPSLKPAVEAWVKQHGATRPLEVRLARPPALHDRYIMIDGQVPWMVGQSFNALAQHAHSSITKPIDPEIAADKVAAYEAIWTAATPMP
jgi:hypothetical protein